MPAVALALYKPHRWWDIGGHLIAWWTRAPYSHCELVVGGLCYSSSVRDGGVRATVIDLDSGHWDLIPADWADPALIRAHYRKTQHQPYDWIGLIGSQIFNRRAHDTRADFCSEWCARALGLPSPETYSPASLGIYCRSRSVKADCA